MSKLHRLLRYDWPVHFALLLTNWLPDNVPFLKLRGACVRPFLGSCGKNLQLGRNVVLYNPSCIHLGRDVYFAYGCCFIAGAGIDVGDAVLCGPYCMLASSSHTRQGKSFRYATPESSPIRIGHGSWLGAHVSVMAGVQVGDGCLIGAGAVVTKDVEPGVLAAGVPAQKVRPLVD